MMTPERVLKAIETVLSDSEKYITLRNNVALADLKGPLFTTDADIFSVYLGYFKTPGERQVHNCNTCKDFFRRYGGLVRIGKNGELQSVFWKDNALRLAVEKAKVTGVFYSCEEILGNPVTGMWTHFSVRNPNPVLDPEGLRVTARENFQNVRSFLNDYRLNDIEIARNFLESGVMHRREKVRPAAVWLHTLAKAACLAVWLHTRAKAACLGRARRDNLIWKAIATAPDGFCHPRASVLGSLVDDIKRGYDHNTIISRFNQHMEPDAYQRPQAPPKAGNIDVAERRVKELGIEKSLVRRFARLEELELCWRPEPQMEAGVFSVLRENKTTRGNDVVRGEKPITAVRFISEVLPQALSIRVQVPSHGDFFAFVTAEHPEAPPILRWDREERRNPVSPYRYVRCSSSSRWGLYQSHSDCVGATRPPASWYGNPLKNDPDGLFFILKGCADSANTCSALFPEILRPELREIRSTIEAYSNRTPLRGYSEATACGISAVGAHVIVELRSGLTLKYYIDRWD